MRKVLFWIHLAVGSIAGIVILIMSITGVLLTYEKQVIAWTDRGFRSHPSTSNAVPMSVDDLLAHAGKPASLVFRSHATAPVEASFGREKTVYFDAYTGAKLGEGSTEIRAFFASVTNWHRWLATAGNNRATGRAITGACNLGFFFLAISGLYLWLPKKKWSVARIKQGLIPRWNLAGKARDWNWHNSVGIWCALPLIVIAGSGVVMSYPWANNLVYRATGSPLPEPGGGGRGGGREVTIPMGDLDRFLLAAKQQSPAWRSITLRIPDARARTVTFAVDGGNGGRPDLRSQLTLDAKTGAVTKWERFSDYNAGRQLRSWLRFAHTGEAAGSIGQTIAGLASLGGILLVYSGFALALRRLAKYRAKRSASTPARIPVTARSS